MKTSENRILTTHVGSLPRPDGLLALLQAQDQGEPYDADALAGAATRAVADCVRDQRKAGIDVVCDGEMSKPGYTFYVRHRLSGIATAEEVLKEVPVRPIHADVLDFPEIEKVRRAAQAGSAGSPQLYCVGDVRHRDAGPIEADIANLTAALDGSGATEGFMNAASPGVLAVFIPNTHYASEDDYIAALAEAMRPEYEKIVAAGFVLQLDCPDVAMARHGVYQKKSEAEFLRVVERNIEALNHATANIAPDRMRLHICWGNYPAPHTHDIPAAKLISPLMKSRPQALVFEASNPRHEHEWEDWKSSGIPDDRILIPGVIDSTSNFVEHPRLIAQRLRRYADIVGRERVIAGTDCGFGTFAGKGHVYTSVVWAKLRALSDGATLASGQLWR